MFCPAGALESMDRCLLCTVELDLHWETMDMSLVDGGSQSLVLLISGLTGLKPIQKTLAVSVIPHVT